jgi:HlyD family secretion protein
MDVGQTVQASYSAPQLFSIAQDLSKMHVETNIDESDISRVQVDQDASFTVDAYPGQTFHGTVMQIRHSPTNVQNVITYTVVIAVDNPDMKLFPGMTANTRLVTDHLSGILKVPAAALRFRPPDDLLPADAKNTDKKTGTGKGDGKFDPSQFKGGDGKFDPSQFKGRNGGGGGGFGRNGGGGIGRGGQGGARPQFQTVYTLDDKGQLKAVRIRTGISDGSFVAMLGGDLKEGDVLVTGIEGARASQSKNAPGFPGGNNNQFKGGRGGFPF